MKKLTVVIALIPLLLIWSCEKEHEKDNGKVGFITSYSVDGIPFMTDTFAYTTEAGYKYRISKLEYFLSGFKLENEDGVQFKSNKILYLNAFRPETNSFELDDVPVGKYKRISFYIGIDSANNISRSLDMDLDMANMAWPGMMGGGYHFMKYEGFFINKDKEEGFAMHIGRNENLVEISLDHQFQVGANTKSKINLELNLNEWFRNPEIYDFVIDGASSMYTPSAMLKLKMNGSSVFSIKK